VEEDYLMEIKLFGVLGQLKEVRMYFSQEIQATVKSLRE